MFSNLLFIDMLRGPDSTGAFSIANNGDVMVAKEATHSVDFMESKEYRDLMQRSWNRGSALIGHNRKATRGNVNDENAHPFNVDDNIILVHNGTMISDHKKHADVEVDSHAIAHLIHEKGNVKEALSAFNGAFALIWWDMANSTLNFIRNDQRPLWWMETHGSWIWSSEKPMLEFVADRLKLNLKEPPTEFPEFHLLQYTLKEKKWEVSQSEKMEIKPPAYSYQGNSSQSAWHMGRRIDRADLEHWAEQTWGDAHADDMGGGAPPARPFRSQQQQSKVIELLPLGPERRSAAANDIPKEPIDFAGNVERERQLAKESNRIVPHGEYQKLLGQFNYKARYIVCPFDYRYVNGTDNSDGYYLYCTAMDDERVIFRKFFSSKIATEEQMIQFAGCGYVYEMSADVRTWNSMIGGMDRGNVRDDEPGFMVIRSDTAELVARGQDAASPHIH